jgi:hypothetical protein
VRFLTSDYLFNTPSGTPTVYFGVMTAFFGALFLLSAFLYWRRAKLAGENPVLRRFVRRVAKAGMWTSGIGLFLALMRYLEIPYLSMPIWLDLLVLSMIAIVGYFVYDLSERYPIAVWRLQEAHVERRYRPAPRSRSEPQRVRPRPKVRGKGRRR